MAIIALPIAFPPQASFAEFAQDSLTVEVSKSGQVKVTAELTPLTTVSRVSVSAITAGNISGVLAVDENDTVLSLSYSGGVIKIDTLGSSHVTLTYDAKIAGKVRASDTWELSYASPAIQSTVVLPSMSDILYVNDVPVDIRENVVTMPPGEVVLRYKIRGVAVHDFVASWDGADYPVQIVTASGVQKFSFEQGSKAVVMDLDGRAPVLAIIPKALLGGPYMVKTSDDSPVDFRHYYQNSTHSWIRVEPVGDDGSSSGARANSIRIIGSTAVPEFSILPALPIGMIVAIILLVVTSRRQSSII